MIKNTKKPQRIVASLATVQVLRCIWQIWDIAENSRPDTIDSLVLPIIIMTCIIDLALIITSVIATWSAFKGHAVSLNACWWTVYALTIFSFFNSSTHVSVLTLSKHEFVSACLMDRHVRFFKEESNSPSALISCIEIWKNDVIWNVLVLAFDLVMNLSFSYALYRCRACFKVDDYVLPNTRMARQLIPLPLSYQVDRHHSHTDGYESEVSTNFEVVELNK